MSKAYNDIKINIPFPESATFLIPLLFLEGAGETSGAYLVSRLVGDQIAAKMGALTGPQWMSIHLLKKLMINPPQANSFHSLEVKATVWNGQVSW